MNTATRPHHPRAAEVLAFWFGPGGSTPPGDEAETVRACIARWFSRDAQVDAAIRACFAGLRDDAIAGVLDDWLATPHGRLALIVLVDQFSRNLFRDDARAFEHDALARAWCIEGLRLRADLTLRPLERLFLYLPLEHSESVEDQRRAVALCTALRDAAPAALRASFQGFLDYAVRHHDVIARFGRFPHRNAALGRASTTQELAFLAQPGSSF